MKRVVIIGSFAESLINFRGHLMDLLVERGYKVIACAPDASKFIRESLKEKQIEYVDLSIDRTGTNPFKDLFTFLNIVRFLRRSKPNYLISYTIKPVIFGSLAAGFYPSVQSFSIITGLGYMFSNPNEGGGLLYRLILYFYKLALKKNKVVIFQNPDDARLFGELQLVHKMTDFAIVNGSGVDLRHYYYAPPALVGSLSFLSIARLIKDKGVYEYVEAARQIKSKYPNIKFYLAGWLDSNPSGISPEELRAWETEGVIDYLGPLEDVRSSIEKCSVYVLPSYREGTPRTVLEAMSMGRPIITTNTPGCKETVEHMVNGYLIKEKSVTDLVLAIEKFIKNPDRIKTMGVESRRIACAKYDVHKVNRELLSILGLE